MVQLLKSGRRMVKSAMDFAKTCEQRLQSKLDPGAVILEGWRPSMQPDQYSCGVQSCFMILRYFGKARSVESVEKELGTDENGTTASAIITLLRRRGLRVGIDAGASLDSLREAIRRGSPVLVSTIHAGGHWVVVYGFSHGCIYVSDPSCKRPFSRWTIRYFMAHWERWALTVSRKIATRKIRNKKR